MTTELTADKTLRQVSGVAQAEDGFWSCLRGQPVHGYEIHMGISNLDDRRPLLNLEGRPDGAARGSVAGTYVHGIFEQPAPRAALLEALASARGYRRPARPEPFADPFDRLADALEASLDLSALPTLAALQSHHRH